MHCARVIFRVSPIAPRVEIPEPQLGSQPKLNSRHRARDLARDEFKATPRAFMIEEDAAHAIHSVSLAIIACQLKACAFADAVRTARMERRRFTLRSLPHLAKHFTRAGKVELALRTQLAQRGQHVMRPVDVGVHGGKAVGEAL